MDWVDVYDITQDRQDHRSAKNLTNKMHSDAEQPGCYKQNGAKSTDYISLKMVKELKYERAFGCEEYSIMFGEPVCANKWF